MDISHRKYIDPLIFLGPAILLLAVFLIAPIVVNFVVSFSDMAQTVTIGDFPTTKQFNKLGKFDDEALFGFKLRGSFLSLIHI